MPENILAYIAGFLDGDGCLMAQLIKRPGYVYGYQIRVSIVFYQKFQNRKHLEWLKKKLKVGYIRERNDGMVEYTIVGKKPVSRILENLIPYLKLKKRQAKLILRITEMKRKPSPKQFLRFCHLVDESAKYNYSKKRTRTTASVIRYLEEHKIFSP